MRKILLLVFVLVSFSAIGQVVQFPTNYGVGYRRTGADTLLWIPTDTFAVPAPLASRTHVARKGVNLYYWTGTKWEGLSGGVTDTASLSNRINLKLNITDTSNKWITSVYRKTASDSVFYVKGGTNTFAFRDSVGSGSGSGNTIYSFGQAWVDSAYGNNSTARPNRPDLPFATINRALDSTSSYASAIIHIGIGTFDSITESKIRKNLWLKGSQMPQLNNRDTATGLISYTRTIPTALIRGTIIKGGIQARNINQIEGLWITDLGFDNGKDWVNAGHPKRNNIDLRLSTTANNANTPPHPLAKNIRIENVVCLGDTSTSSYHALTIENAIDPIVRNVLLVYNTHGLAVKTVGGIYDGIYAYSNASDGIILKSNNYAPGNKMQLSNFHIGSLNPSIKDGSGLGFQNELSGAGEDQGQIVVTNGVIENTINGIFDLYSSTYGEYNHLNISNVVIKKTSGTGVDLRNVNKSILNNIIVDSAGGNGIDIRQGSRGYNSVYNSHVRGTTYSGIKVDGNSKMFFLQGNILTKNNVGIELVNSSAKAWMFQNVIDSNNYGMSGYAYGEGNILQNSTVTTNGQFVAATDSIGGIPYINLAGTGNRVMGLTSTGVAFRTSLDPAALGSSSSIVSDSAWSLEGNTVASGIKYLGTKNSRSVNLITNNTIRIKVDSVGNFDFNPGAAAGYTYNFAAYTSASFLKIGYGNVAYSGVTIGTNATGIVKPRLLIQGYDSDIPLLDVGDGNASTIRLFRYSSNGVGMKTTNYNNIPFTFGGTYAFKAKTLFGDSVLTTSIHSTVQIAGSLATAYVAKAVDYTATDADNVIEVTATGKTITLPTAVGITGRQYTIKLTASGSATVATTSSQTIDGATTYSIASQYKYVTVVSNGSNWIVTANN